MDRGERVLSPRQNQDLTAALENGGIGGIHIENLPLNLHLPNVSTKDDLFNMNRQEWEALMVDKVVPALRRVSGWGYKV